MAEADRREREHTKRNSDRWIGLLIVLLAVISGVLAGSLASPKSWERADGVSSTPVSLQGSP